MPKKKSKKTFWNHLKEDSHRMHFFGILVLFAGFSVYAISSFFFSTDRYLDAAFTSVVGDQFGNMTESIEKEEPEKPYEIFSDVMSDQAHAEAIEALRDLGVIGGYPDGSFKPDNTINRAELLAILTTAVDADLADGSYANCFSDVKEEWYSAYVCYAKKAEWVKGYSDGSFGPGQAVVKEEALKIVLSAFEYKIPERVDQRPYQDVVTSTWFAPYAAVAVESGILDQGGDFAAGTQLTRADFVEMLYRAMDDKDLLE